MGAGIGVAVIPVAITCGIVARLLGDGANQSQLGPRHSDGAMGAYVSDGNP